MGNFDFDLAEKKAYIGLDYGTYRSFMAVKQENEAPQIAISVDNSCCQSGIPSLFWTDNNKTLLCDEVAKRNLTINDPEGVVSSVKMLVNDNIETVTIKGKEYKISYINDEIIKKIFEISVHALEDIFIEEYEKRVVMGVPVTFGTNKRKILKNSVKKLGYECELLSEPTAAALYYAYSLKINFETLLVLDIGAGTFDAAILERNNNRNYYKPEPFEIKAQGGNHFAGNRCDDCLVEILIDKIRANPGTLDINKITDTRRSEYRQLKVHARVIKERLSDIDTFTHTITAGTHGAATVTVTRSEFENKIRNAVINPALDIAETLVNNQNLSNKSFKIILVGGSSHIPLVKKAVAEKFYWIPKKDIIIRNPEKAVALGCALYAEEPAFKRKIAYGYAIQTYDENMNTGLDVCVPSNIKLPYTFESQYATLFDGQTGMAFKVYEVPNCMVGDFLKITEGKFTSFMLRHNFGKSVPQGTPVKLKIQITEDGILNMDVIDNIVTGTTTSDTFNIGTEKV